MGFGDGLAGIRIIFEAPRSWLGNLIEDYSEVPATIQNFSIKMHFKIPTKTTHQKKKKIKVNLSIYNNKC
jgi:hypothetical protein